MKVYILGSILCLLVVLALLASWSHYYHYGVKRDAASLRYHQADPHYITGEYEFESILFQSADGGELVVTLQHPIHPLPEPDTFISQVGFKLAHPEAKGLHIKHVTLEHLDANGVKIQPTSTSTIPDRLTGETGFYVTTYSRAALTPTLTEVATISFSYRGEPHEIVFREHVALVKRWNKLLAILNM